MGVICANIISMLLNVIFLVVLTNLFLQCVLNRSSDQFDQPNTHYSIDLNQASTSTAILSQDFSADVSKSRLTSASSLFSNASIGKIEGCTFTFNNYATAENSTKTQVKRRRIIISDDCDSD